MKFQIKRLLQNDTAYAKELNTVFSIAFNDSASYQDKKPSDDYLVSILSDPSIIVLISLYNNSVVGGLVAYQLKKMEQARSEVYIYDLAVKEDILL